MLNSYRRLLRMEENARGENSLFHRDERRLPFRFRGPLGWLAKSSYQRVVTNLCDHHRRTKRAGRPIHTRMPVILPTETHDAWLSGEAGKEILRPFPANEMTARPISKRISKPENPSVLEAGEMEHVGRLI